MTARRSVAPTGLPDLTRDDVTHVVLRRWTAQDSREQGRTAERVRSRAWGSPAPAPTSRTVFRGEPGHVVLEFQQWTGPPVPPAHPAITADGEPTTYEPWRSILTPGPSGPVGAVVMVTFGLGTREDAVAWSGLLADAVLTQPEPTPGCLSRHLHLGADGGVLLYSEWRSVADHRASIEAPDDSAGWRAVESYPGLVHGPGARCPWPR